jgi:hypothetical protein
MTVKPPFIAFALLAAAVAGSNARAFPALADSLPDDAPTALDRYNVVWDSPSTGANGSMPLGNGEVGLNLWVEKNGDLLFYVARTDAWSECCQLLKLGCMRLSVTPNPFVANAPFRQTLRLRQGCVEITAGPIELRVFVNAQLPVVYVTGHSNTPVRVKASLEVWRTRRRDLKAEETSYAYNNAGSWTMRGAEYGPKDVEVWESPDVVEDLSENAVVWYHRNAYSIVPFTMRHQGLESVERLAHDPLLNRTFGGWISAPGFVKEGKTTLRSAGNVYDFELRVVTHTAQTPTANAWREAVQSLLKQSPSAREAAERTADWWDKFWGRSWVYVAGDSTSPGLTQAYILQRWMNACGGRGNYPIKFNGSIFTVDPKYTGKPDQYSPDWREWGDCYWWQNTRLPYQPLPACGDFDLMRPLFRFYGDAAELCKARAKIYHQVPGVYFPETMTIFGSYGNGDYGWDRRYVRPRDVMCPAWQYCWQQGLELVGVMLDYYDYMEDDVFLAGQLMPMARDVLAYFSARFPRDPGGRIKFVPTQMLETYRPQDVLDNQGRVVGRQEVVNDMPTVAGLHSVLSRLLDLPSSIPSDDGKNWRAMNAILPPLALGTDNGKQFIRPAQEYPKNAWNIENGELYAVSPFRLFTVGKPNLETGVNTYRRRLFLDVAGWTYDGQCAALLGMTDEAQRQVLAKAANKHPNHRFPAMWGPNYDWLPDQTLGGNLMLTLQYMVVQADRDKIYLLPAWPKTWDVRFKLHAPKRTVVEGAFVGGKLAKLVVTPPERRSDVVLPGWAARP